MVYTIKTPQCIDTVKKELEAKAKEVGFGLLNTYEFKQILEEKGYPIEKDITVYELCNPPGAQQALSQLPEISVYLPCRISVYEDKGKTTLSSIGLEDIIGAFDIDERFKTYMTILFENLKKVMHSWDK
ncbi:MAG TPA: DUF302 domain-containing protein [Sulfurovum sp.]|nr:DUF302 domain-containing protein [Sulfurovum sp.]